MATMGDAVGGFTRADLDALPDYGRRHELIDGAFLVTPSPGLRHQDLVLRLAMLLWQPARDAGLHVVVAPFDVALSDDTVVVPDLVVAPRASFTDRDLPVAPLLVVEVRSPSTQRIDRLVKREVYERAGVPSYWLVDPREPAVTVLELQDGRYVERGTIARGESLQVTRPLPVTLAPATWLPPAG